MIVYVKLILVFIVAVSSTLAGEINEEYCSLLGESKTVSASQILNFPIVRHDEHSMANALPVYVCQKIPCSLIKEAVDRGSTIEILGSPPPLLHFCSSHVSDFELDEITVNYDKKVGKKENFRRPSFYYKTGGERVLVMSVMAGEDYIKQFAALVSHYVKFGLGKNPDDIVRVTRFPLLEENLGLWTHLDNSFVKPNDTVLIGNVSDFYDYLQEGKFLSLPVEESENFYYKATRVKLGHRTLCFLRVKYSFWGNMSANLVTTMLDLGASEIIYMSKIATLDDPGHIYKKIYSPTQFAVLRDKKIEMIDHVFNPLVDKFPELDSGIHLSLSTVMEQDFETAALARSVATSLDLEVSNIAQAISEYNAQNEREVIFTPVHWVTDYIRTREEAHLDTGFDLTNGNTDAGKVRKQNILTRIYDVVAAYLMETDLVVNRPRTMAAA